MPRDRQVAWVLLVVGSFVSFTAGMFNLLGLSDWSRALIGAGLFVLGAGVYGIGEWRRGL